MANPAALAAANGPLVHSSSLETCKANAQASIAHSTASNAQFSAANALSGDSVSAEGDDEAAGAAAAAAAKRNSQPFIANSGFGVSQCAGTSFSDLAAAQLQQQHQQQQRASLYSPDAVAAGHGDASDETKQTSLDRTQCSDSDAGASHLPQLSGSAAVLSSDATVRESSRDTSAALSSDSAASAASTAAAKSDSVLGASFVADIRKLLGPPSFASTATATGNLFP